MTYKETIAQVDIPPYTAKQEFFNGVSHALGIIVALIISLIALVSFSNNDLSLVDFIGLLVFVSTITAVYFVSSLYHFTAHDDANKKAYRVLDHCTIYLLIAGTYTPVCLSLMDQHIIGLIMLIIEWSCALLGIIMNAFFFNKKYIKVLSLILYLAMGWLVLVSGGFLYMTPVSFGFILAGGIVYSIGSILYSVGKKNLNFHCIFHVFVLLSTIVQAVGVLSIFF